MSIPSESLNLINELLESVRDLGVSGTTIVLQNARSNSLTLSDKNVEFVLKMISNHYKLPIEEITRNTRSKYTIKRNALSFSIYYLHNSFEYSFGQLKNVFNRDKSQLSRFNAFIIREVKSNSTLVTTKSKFDLMINTFINNKESYGTK